MGGIGLSYDDFCRLTFPEFREVCKVYNSAREDDYRTGWEQVRTEAAIMVQPHTRKRIKPRELLPLPWDKADAKKAPKVSAAEDKARLIALLGKMRGRG